MLDAGDHVDNVPMPAEMRDVLIAYTAAHYKPEPRARRCAATIRRGAPSAANHRSGSGESRG